MGIQNKSEKSADCWFLSAINALNSSQAGRKILNETIVKNSDGSYTITLKGAKIGKKVYVYLINPSDSSKMIKISKEAFIEHLCSIFLLQLDDKD